MPWRSRVGAGSFDFPPVSKVAVIGLDCAEPTLVFDRWLDELPNLGRLVRSGTWGRLRSVDPPITVPAWSCMLTGRDPGELGIYGFRNRHDHGYDSMYVADSKAVPIDRVWDHLGRAGRHVVVVGVPQTSPPVPVNGELVSCFLTADTRTDPYTHPPELHQEIERLAGPYQVDVRNFRSDDRDRILAEIYAMTEQRFTVCRHLLDTRPWEFFMVVEIGLDRLHHAFWRFMDPAHPRHEPSHRYREVIRSYYGYLDDEIGELLERFDDDTTVIVVSDHGARPMEGAVCVNEWLRDEGYLVLHDEPDGPIPFRDANVDWSRTRAWGEGGYYCRLCLNRKGPSIHPNTSGFETSWPSGSSSFLARTAGRSAHVPSVPRSSGASRTGSRRTSSSTSATLAGAAMAASATAGSSSAHKGMTRGSSAAEPLFPAA